jgi:hypothetical protein
MPRFSAVFPRRKSTAPDELLNAEPAGPEQHSFRVLERNTFAADGRSFDGGVRLSQRIGNPTYHKPRNSELDVEDNLFAGLNINRLVAYACHSRYCLRPGASHDGQNPPFL